MNFNKMLRKFAILLLVVASVLTLAACNKTESYPQGSLGDTEYASFGDYSVSESELYDQLRLQASDVLADKIEKIMFESEIAEATALLDQGDQDTLDYFYELINDAIYGDAQSIGYSVDVTDHDDLMTFYNDKPELYVRALEIYADSLYLTDNSLDLDAFITTMRNLVDPFAGYEDIDVLFDTYVLAVAKRLYAQNILEDEVVDEDSSYYVEESDVVSYYKNNEEGQYDVNALVIRFLNLNEANAALYEVGIKADSKGNWYAIPDIRILPGNPGYIDLTDTASYQYIVDMLDDLNLTSKLGVGYVDRDNLSQSDYESYYKAYIISNTREDGIRDTENLLSTDEVKAKFVDIYNILNPTATIQIDGTGNVVGDSDTAYTSLFTYDDLTSLDTTVRSHIYNTLTAEALMDDPNDTTEDSPYSSRVQTGNSYRFLVFKLNDDSASQENILVEDPDNDDEEIFGDSVEAQAKYEELLAEVIENKLTASYITSKVNALYEDVSIDIYDPIIRIIYSQTYDYSGTEKGVAGNNVAKVNDTYITVDDMYTRLEKAYGINLSYDLLINLVLSDSDEYTVDDDTLNDYQDQFETIMSNFTADSYSPTYPASMGRQAFLLVAFGAKTNAEAIKQLYVYPDLRQQYIDDIENHFDNTNASIYEKFAQLADKQYDNEQSITVSHLLIYVDQDANGSPDDPAEYLDSLTPAASAAVQQGVVDLVNYIYDHVGDYTSFAAGLSTLASNYSDSIRIEQGRYDTTPYEIIDEDVWVQFRLLGLNVKYEAISTPITNASNIMTNSSTLDQVFYDRAIELYNDLVGIKDDDGVLPYLDMYDQNILSIDDITDSDLNDDTTWELNLQSSFGWHFMLVTAIGDKTSAMLSAADDTNEDYVATLDDDSTVNLYNELSDKLTANQIKYYLKSQEADEAFNFDTDVQTALNTYFSPVLAIYENTYMQRELIFKLLDGITYASATNSARVDVIRNINKRQMNSYLLSTIGGVYDQNYANLYADWFTIIEG